MFHCDTHAQSDAVSRLLNDDAHDSTLQSIKECPLRFGTQAIVDAKPRLSEIVPPVRIRKLRAPSPLLLLYTEWVPRKFAEFMFDWGAHIWLAIL